jgi:hypothetical protein
MGYKVRLVESWDEVHRLAAADTVSTCIRESGPNHQRAASAWEQHYPDSLRYYASDDPPGYLRLLRLTQNAYTRTQTWAVDFCKPMDYEFIIAVAQVFEHTLLVKRVHLPDSKYETLAIDWPAITAEFPRLGTYPYHVQESYEATWLVVPRAATPKLSA